MSPIEPCRVLVGPFRRRATHSRGRRAGFTLLELLVALGIAATLGLIALPGFRQWIESSGLRDEAEALARAMTFARFEAIKRGGRVNLCKSTDGRRCDEDGGWESGWILFFDEDGDGDRGDDEPVLRREGPAPTRISIRGNRPVEDYVSYTPEGHARMVSGALQMGTFVLCRPGQRAWRLVLAHSGRVRLERGDACDG